MSVLDFLFEGSPPPSVTTYGSTASNMPQWLSDYTQALISRANATAAEPYQAYTGPRIAGFTDDQNNAFDVVRNNIGDWKDEVGQAGELAGGALNQATPYLQQAGQSFGAPQAQQYMDPYVGNVIDRATLEANRNLNEKIMPGIEGKFVHGGQYGSSAHLREANQAARDTTEGVQSQALAALSGAYGQAGQLFGQDASRQAQVGQTLGNLGLNAANTLTDVAKSGQDMALRDAGTLEAVGQTQQQQTQRNLDLAQGDFAAQRDYPKDQLQWLQSIIAGTPHDSTTTNTSVGPGSVYGPSPLSQIISGYGLYKDVRDDLKGKAQGGLVHYSGGGKVSTFSDTARKLMEMVRQGKIGHTDAARVLTDEHRVPAGQALGTLIRHGGRTPYMYGGLACLEH